MNYVNVNELHVGDEFIEDPYNDHYVVIKTGLVDEMWSNGYLQAEHKKTGEIIDFCNVLVAVIKRT